MKDLKIFQEMKVNSTDNEIVLLPFSNNPITLDYEKALLLSEWLQDACDLLEPKENA